MKRVLACLAILFLASSVQARLDASYNIALEENGNALVVLVVKGIGNVNVPLPLDVESPAVRGALYIPSENGVDVSIDDDGTSTIVYKSALLADREGEEWTFLLETPRFDSASIILTIPDNTEIIKTEPTAAVSNIKGNKNVIWNINPGNTSSVSLRMRYTEPAEPAVEEPREDAGQALLKAALLALAILIILLAAYIYNSTRKGTVYSSGKQNVLKTLTGNETKIVNMLLQEREYGMQRNKLERESGIAKSSLASALQNLEKKNVVTVDRTYTTHYLELTEWFKSL
mgnify:CR=1 FL=1